MYKITQLFIWLETRLDDGAWFRRIYVVVATVMTWKVVEWSMNYVTSNPTKDGAQMALIIGAISGIAAGVQGFAFTAYLQSRKESGSSTSSTTITKTTGD